MADQTVEQLDPISGAGGLSPSDLLYVFRPGVTDLDFKASGNDLITFVESETTAFADASHTHTLSEITDSGSLAALNEITDSEIAAGAAIQLSKLAVDPLARSNHTGTQTMSTISDAGALATLNTVTLSLIDNITANRIVGSDGTGDVVALTASQVRTLLNVEDGADVTDATNVNAAGAVMETDYDANTILKADSDNTPVALTVPLASLIGRKTSGSITSLNASDIRTLIGVTLGAEPNQNAFTTIAVQGEDSVVADSKTDTLTLKAGTDIEIITDAGTDTITIRSTAAGVGGVVGPATHGDNMLARWDGVNTKTLQSSGIDIDDVSNMSGVNNLDIDGLFNGRDPDADGAKLDTIQTGAQANQNAFARIKVPSQQDIVADSTVDILNIEGGDNVQVSTNHTTDTLTISVPSTGDLGDTFSPATHPDDNVPVFEGADSKTLRASSVFIESDGDMSGVKNLTTTGTINGRNIAVDGVKLDGIQAGAQVNEFSFKTIKSTGETDIVADSASDTLRIEAGTNTSIDFDAATDTITINAALVGTGDTLAPASHDDDVLPVFEGSDSKQLRVTGITIDPSDNISGVGDITLTGTVDGRDVSVDGAKLDTIQSGAERTDASNVDSAGAVMETDYGAFTILAADVNDTPTSLTVSPSTFVGRKSSGGIVAMTPAEARTELNVEDGAQVNTNSFSTIVVASEDDILALNDDDTLTIVAGTNVTLDTNVSSRQLTINANLPPTSGDVQGPATHTNHTIPRWNGDDTKDLQASDVEIDDLNNLSGINDISLGGTVDGRDIAVDGTKLDGIEAGAQVNQDAFSTITVSGESDVVADGESDSLALDSDTTIVITTSPGTDTINFAVGEITTAHIQNGTITNDDISSSAGIELSKLETDPLARSNHTGTQTMSTISDAGALATLNTVGTSEIDDSSVTLNKLADITTNSFLGRDTAGAGTPEVLTPAQARNILNVEDGADVTDTANVDAAGAVMNSDYDANTILAANVDNAPLPLSVATNTLLGRLGGNIDDLTPSQVKSIITYVLNDLTNVNAPSPTDGQALIYNTGSGQWIPGTAGGLVPLLTATASSSSAINFTGFLNSSLYRSYVLIGEGIRTSINGGAIGLQTSSNGGTSWDAGADDYEWSISEVADTFGGDFIDGEVDLSDPSILLARDIGNSTGFSGRLKVTFGNLMSSNWKLFGIEYSCIDTADDPRAGFGAGSRESTTAMNAIRLIPRLGGTITTGNFTLYGLRI